MEDAPGLVTRTERVRFSPRPRPLDRDAITAASARPTTASNSSSATSTARSQAPGDAGELSNVAASVRQRLLNRARAERTAFQELATLYAMERFLFRLGETSTCVWGEHSVEGALARVRGHLARARRFRAWLDVGAGRTATELAELEGISKGRVSQLMALLELAPEIDLAERRGVGAALPPGRVRPSFRGRAGRRRGVGAGPPRRSDGWLRARWRCRWRRSSRCSR